MICEQFFKQLLTWSQLLNWVLITCFKANECLKQRNISTRNLFVNSIGNNEEGCRFIGNDARFTTKQVCLSVLFLFQHFKQCGTTETVTDEEIIYTNKIVNRYMDANIGIMFAPRLEQTIRCKVQRILSFETSYGVSHQ